jgi:hypothetical protein
LHFQTNTFAKRRQDIPIFATQKAAASRRLWEEKIRDYEAESVTTIEVENVTTNEVENAMILKLIHRPEMNVKSDRHHRQPRVIFFGIALTNVLCERVPSKPQQ